MASLTADEMRARIGTETVDGFTVAVEGTSKPALIAEWIARPLSS